MSKIIKFTSFLVFLISIKTTVNATSMVCPTNITCIYDKGSCDQPEGWFIYYWNWNNESNLGASEQYFSLSGIAAVLPSNPNIYPSARIKKTSIVCNYGDGRNSLFIALISDVKKLIGSNWAFSGFGKQNVNCQDISDPTLCAGIK